MWSHLQASSEWETDITASLTVSKPSSGQVACVIMFALPLHALPLLRHCQPAKVHS